MQARAQGELGKESGETEKERKDKVAIPSQRRGVDRETRDGAIQQRRGVGRKRKRRIVEEKRNGKRLVSGNEDMREVI